MNLVKSDFGHVGQGQVKPVTAKVEAIINYPVPSNKKEIMSFLGMSFVRTHMFFLFVNLISAVY